MTRKQNEQELEDFQMTLIRDIGKVEHVHHVLYQGIKMRVNNIDPGWTKVFFRHVSKGHVLASTHMKLSGKYADEIAIAKEWFEKAYPGAKNGYILTHE
jgi:hypothetical protein